jgi:hypothetical protein
MQKFGLALHPNKTRLIEFGRFATENRLRRGEGKPESFDFLGFTHSCARTRLNRVFTIRRQTITKRLRAKLQTIHETLMKRRHEPISTTGKWLQGVVRGYYNYHAIPGNTDALETFHREVIRLWLHALRRRTQRHRLPWTRFRKIANRWIPRPRILHPHPSERFFATHPR